MSKTRCCARTWSCPPGGSSPREREFTLRTDTNLRTEMDFRNLVVGRGADGYLVRLSEVAEVRLASEDDRSISRSNGVVGLSMAILPQSKANVLATSAAVKKRLAAIQATLPKDLVAEINIDNGMFIAASLKNVVLALSETLILVLVVIFVFLGTLRATLIPAVTIPVSIIAAAMVMLVLDYSINTLTLLGAVLAIGLVVDDAIVVLENIVRRIEGGEPAVLASINGSREIGFAVIATTLVLMAVFVPVSFMTGDTGRLFGEFGVTVAAAVGFSAFVALTHDADDDLEALRQRHAEVAYGGRHRPGVPQSRRAIRACPSRCDHRAAAALDRRWRAGNVWRRGHVADLRVFRSRA